MPQVFCNDNHIGGADSVLATLAIWDGGNKKCNNTLQRFQVEIQAVPDPFDQRLFIHTMQPLEDIQPLPRNETCNAITLPDG